MSVQLRLVLLGSVLAASLLVPALQMGTELGVVRTPGGSVSVIPPGWQDAALPAAELESVAYHYDGQISQIELPKDNQGGAASAMMVPPFGSGAGIDSDADGIIDSREDALAEDFAPIILHDRVDANLPTAVDWLLERTSIEYYNNNGLFHKDDHVPHGGPPLTQSALLGQSGSFAGGTVRSDGTRSRNRQHTFALLDVSPPDRQGSLRTSDWKTYVHEFRNYYGGVSIQYWRCYAFNTGDQTAHLPIEIDHHGGDWEAVEVVLSRDLTPVQYRFLGHTGIEVRSSNQVMLDGKHVIVFSEPGGHASHARFVMGDTIKVHGFEYHLWLSDLTVSSNVIRQETWSGGTVTWPSANWRGHVGGANTQSGGLVNIGEKITPRNGQVFVKYSGLWGSLGANFSGYWGPAYNETDMASDGLITAWCYGMKASKSNIGSLHSECYPAQVSE